MREKIKNFSKKYLIGYLPGFILGVISACTVSVIASTYFPSNDVTYDNSVSGLQSTNVQDAIDELYGVCFPPTGSDTITDLVDTNPDELYKDEHGDIRYYGESPNNYVSFNNELWRIIGVIDGKIKIIRNESIGKYEWASNGSNNWNNSDLKSYLNGDYYDNIDETYRNMISTNETFYLGGPTSSNYTSLTASGYYDVERSNSVYSGNPTTTTQSIGLMYPSDYGYATSGGSTADKNSCLNKELYKWDSSSYSDCKNNDWLYSVAQEWLQAPYASNSNYATYLTSSGYVILNYYGVTDSFAVRPVLYLTSTTQITGGDGSQSNPYTISYY